ncbi:MAG: hypothetical protein EOP00_01505 [Pedobacter sp.]|nr:MAG: hypothetical protein EOP00_01505 [Pedobacter sp.]
MKIISPKFHAILDYVTVIFLIAAPKLFLLSDVASTFCYLLAGVHLLITICTDFSGGLFKVIPLRIHGLIEFFVAFGLAVAAFTYFRGNMTDHLFFACLGLVIIIVFLLTDYKKIIK